MIERKKYMSLLEKWRDKKVIKVVTGVRRCGKSSLLRMFREKLSDNGVEERQILEFNFEDLSNEPFLDYHVLYSHIRKNLCGDRMNYIFFDEIQMVENFQKVCFCLITSTFTLRAQMLIYCLEKLQHCSPADMSKSSFSHFPSQNTSKHCLRERHTIRHIVIFQRKAGSHIQYR